MNIFPITDEVQNMILILGSGFLAFGIAVFLAPWFIKTLRKYKIGKNIREVASDGKAATLFHQLHSKKAGTPTMGGILIWGVSLLVVLLSRLFSYLGVVDTSLLNRKETYLPLFTLLTMGLLGAVDDWFNIKGLGKSKGINIKPKFFFLTVFAVLGSLWFYFKLGYDQIHVPGVGDFMIGLWYIPLFIFIILASANSTNFTDGLDGLAGGLMVIAFAAFGVLAYVDGLLILSALCAVIAGATLAFLWFNLAPASFYMGDTGSIALGSTLGVMAMMTDTVLILPFLAFIPVVETLSIIIQLTSKKFFHRKVFHIAPIHHHFEHLGWPETLVVMRFWIVGALFASVGLILGLIGQGI